MKKIEENSFLLATQFDLLLLSCQFWHLFSTEAEKRQIWREKIADILMFRWIRKKNTFNSAMWKSRGRTFFWLYTIANVVHVCVSEFSSHSQHFLLSTVEFNIIKNASVSELECRNVKRQSKRRKLNSSNIAERAHAWERRRRSDSGLLVCGSNNIQQHISADCFSSINYSCFLCGKTMLRKSITWSLNSVIKIWFRFVCSGRSSDVEIHQNNFSTTLREKKKSIKLCRWPWEAQKVRNWRHMSSANRGR